MTKTIILNYRDYREMEIEISALKKSLENKMDKGHVLAITRQDYGMRSLYAIVDKEYVLEQIEKRIQYLEDLQVKNWDNNKYGRETWSIRKPFKFWW